MPHPSRFGPLLHVSRFVLGPPRACPSDSPRPTSSLVLLPKRSPILLGAPPRNPSAAPAAAPSRTHRARAGGPAGSAPAPRGSPSPSAARGREPTCPSAAAAMIRAAVNCARPGVAPEKNVPAPPCSHPLPRDGRPSLPASQARPGSPTTERPGAGPCCRAHAPQVHPFPLAAAAARGGSQERPGAEDSGHHGPRVPADLRALSLREPPPPTQQGRPLERGPPGAPLARGRRPLAPRGPAVQCPRGPCLAPTAGGPRRRKPALGPPCVCLGTARPATPTPATPLSRGPGPPAPSAPVSAPRLLPRPPGPRLPGRSRATTPPEPPANPRLPHAPRRGQSAAALRLHPPHLGGSGGGSPARGARDPPRPPSPARGDPDVSARGQNGCP